MRLIVKKERERASEDIEDINIEGLPQATIELE